MNVERWPKTVILTFGLALAILIGTADLVTDLDLSFYVLYAVPIFIVAWFVGFWSGILVASVSTFIWFVSDYINVIPFHPALPYINAAIRLPFFLAISLVLHRLKEAFARETMLAGQDSLTGLTNRRAFYSLAAAEVTRSKRYGRPFTVIYMDLDNFKEVNDRKGHQVGDELLRQMSDLLKDTTRDNDIVARIGGDEFIILFPETPAKEGELAIRKLQQALSLLMQQKEWPVTFSIGAVTYYTPPINVDQMVGTIDKLMYEAKRTGRNQLKHEISGEAV